MDSYEDGITRLVEQIRRMNAGTWSPTGLRQEVLGVADQLDSLIGWLELDGIAQDEIQSEHDSHEGFTYASTVWRLRELSASARRVEKALPDARERFVLPFAALAMLHLRYHHEFPPAKLSNKGADVAELQRICEAAGVFKTPDAFRNALSIQRKKFDPTFQPPGIAEVLGW